MANIALSPGNDQVMSSPALNPALNNVITMPLSSDSIGGAGCADTTISRRDLIELLQQSGGQSCDYFLLQNGISYFGDRHSGIIAFRSVRTLAGSTNIVFANPLASPDKLEPLIQRFLATSPYPVLFVGIDEVLADLLVRQGYSKNWAGTESVIPLKDFNVTGKHKKQLRHAANLGRRSDVVVKEQTWADVDQAQVRAVSADWRQGKRTASRELRLLTRPPVFTDEWGVRKFYAWQGDRLLGYVFFDPYYRDGQLKGYCANIIRTRAEAGVSAVADFIVLSAMQTFRAEGIEEVSLGLSPLHRLQPVKGERRLFRRLMQLMYRFGNRLYAFQGLAYHKTRYRPQESPRFMCLPPELPSWFVIWGMMKGTGIIEDRSRNHPAESPSGIAPEQTHG